MCAIRTKKQTTKSGEGTRAAAELSDREATANSEL